MVFNILKTIVHVFCLFLVVSSMRGNLVSVTLSWPEMDMMIFETYLDLADAGL